MSNKNLVKKQKPGYYKIMETHINCLKQACINLDLSFKEIDNQGLFLSVKVNNKSQYFISNRVPLNNHMTALIIKDKYRAYQLLNKLVRMPKTIYFMDPNVKDLYQPYLKEKNLEEITQKIKRQLKFPVIIKKNTGSQGNNVFEAKNKKEAKTDLEKIFNHNSQFYDHIALVQEKIEIKKEYRVTVINKKIELIYHKDNSDAQFNGNLSPLHWDHAVARLVEDKKLKNKIQEFINPIFDVLELSYGGFDIVIDNKNQLWLLEINSFPAYDYFVRDNGEEKLVKIYEKMLKFLLKKQKNMLK